METNEIREKLESLEGKEILVTEYDFPNKKIKAVISGCDYDVGISIQSLEGKYLYCHQGNSSPRSPYSLDNRERNMYYNTFLKHVSKPTFSIYNYMQDIKLKNIDNAAYTERPTSETCPFS